MFERMINLLESHVGVVLLVPDMRLVLASRTLSSDAVWYKLYGVLAVCLKL